MAYCTECGKQIPNDAKFCPSCGKPVLNDNSENKIREQVFEGRLHKCPNCGSLTDSFEIKCKVCGYEIRDSKSSNSVEEFSSKLIQTTNVNEKAELISNFPIPNTKEDVIEFMLLASSNIQMEDETKIFNAWISRFEQAHQKANIVLKDERDIQLIEDIYDKTKKKIASYKARKGASNVIKETGNAIVKTGNFISTAVKFLIDNILTIVGIVICAISVKTNQHGGNSSMQELVGLTLLWVSAGSLSKRSVNFVAYGICAASAVYVIFASKYLDNGSMFELGGFIIAILLGVNITKSSIAKIKKKEGE